MTSVVEARQTFNSPSTLGALSTTAARGPVIVGVILVGMGTSAAAAWPADIVSRSPRPMLQTTAGASIVLAQAAGAAIGQLRRLSGLTWDQLARLFKVSRRSIHFWASGKAMTPANEEHLQRLISVLRRIDRGSATANRAELLAVHSDGAIAFDLLLEGKYEHTLSLVGPGNVPPRLILQPLSREARAAREPSPPEDLVGALQDRAHRETGRVRAAKSVKARSDR